MVNIKNALLSVTLILALTFSVMAIAETHIIKSIGTAFNPIIVFAEPGDTITWINMPAHNTKSINSLIPQAAKPWQSQMGQDFSITLEEEGIYLYECNPHLSFGMAGAIVVGKPTNLTELDKKVKHTHGAIQRVFRKTKEAIGTTGQQ
ncbi:plastocyanin/azurin family copper-binding protein [Nitrosococcus watsonii]|uniref:Blue (Type 1) copper domain protein n=1 Tax=Nitrosococcus watsoni (strain C-113) TaxID=105559 RepID=D8K9P5_NITWC|nr:plastocyanin/azurin family copper-binding protein [Nitrosococcus watsonii]ADJ27334.1 blue (type 1) copper domain protein [Nitrosococcus watsonii C-113]